ncbi:hypothetical protein NON20_15120 [Synechocystis sp. B12]|nr:hypothetical protein NON20_15120 [Synechocystis sp. B12]
MTMEKIVTQAQNWLEELLTLMGFPSTVTVAENKENTLVMGPWLVIEEKIYPQARLSGC